METAILVAQIIGFIATFIGILGIRRKSKQVISQGDKSYHFDIVYGPSAEEILLCRYPEDWPPHFGFEVAPYHEPERYRYSGSIQENVPKGRKAVSYLFCPDRLSEICSKGTDCDHGDYLSPDLYGYKDEVRYKKEIDEFLKNDEQILVMNGNIHKEERGCVNAYFGGGELFKYGTDWKMKITYDCKTRTGRMVVVEK
jgi:hypothetical protein